MEKEGFKTVNFDDNELAVAQAIVINARFTVGSVTEVLEVNGSAAAEFETETGPLSTVIDSKTMNDLPLRTSFTDRTAQMQMLY